MVKRRPKDDRPDLPALLGEILTDAETLMGQQFRLLRSEVSEELGRAGGAALEVGAGAGLVAAGGLFTAVALAQALHHRTRLPLWGCYGLVGGLLGATGVALLAEGGERASRVHLLPPPQTAAALQENLTWLREQVG